MRKYRLRLELPFYEPSHEQARLVVKHHLVMLLTHTKVNAAGPPKFSILDLETGETVDSGVLTGEMEGTAAGPEQNAPGSDDCM